ncbi:hypothetical protein D3C80_979250 [compost metagenome]
MLVILIQPGIERLNCIQLEREPQQAFTLGGGKLAVELVEAVQQIEFGQYHVQWQARPQLGADFVQACAQPMGQRDALVGLAMQQRRQVDDQQHTIKRPLASITHKPAQQVLPQPGLCTERREGSSLGGVVGGRASRGLLTDEDTGRVNDHGIVADPPTDRVSRCFNLSTPCLGLVDSRQGKALIGAVDEAGFTGFFIAQHQVPGQPVQGASPTGIVEVSLKPLAQRLLLRLHER